MCSRLQAPPRLCHRMRAADAARRSTTIDWLPSTCAYRLRADGRAAARLALSGLRRPRGGARARANRSAAGRSARTRPAISNTIWSTASCERAIEVVRHRARARMQAGVDPASGRVRLTLPRARRVDAGARLGGGQGEWIAGAAGEAAASRGRSSPGADDPVRRRDADDRLAGDAASPRSPRVGDAPDLRRPARGLSSGGSRVAAARGAEAAGGGDRRISPPRPGSTVSTVAVGDPAARWGSCSSSRRDPL